MTKPMIAIHDISTGEVIEREMNVDELAQLEIDKQTAIDAKNAAQAKAAAKASAEAKLATLGLTADEVAALLG